MLCTLPERILRVSFTLKNPTHDSFKTFQYFLKTMKSFDRFEAKLETFREGKLIQEKIYDLHDFYHYTTKYTHTEKTNSTQSEILNKIRWVANMRKVIKELGHDLIYYQHGGISDYTLNQIESRLSEDGHSYNTFHWTLYNAKHLEFYGLELWAEKLGVPIESIPDEHKKHLNPINRNELKLQ